jgi:chromosome segregation ATPase
LFYFRYKYKDVVNELRGNLKSANKELEYLNHELDEFTHQNAILKEKVTELLDKNDELSEVVAELSKYYVHIKRASEKTSELTKFLADPNPEIEEKMKNILKRSEDISSEKTFF